MTRMMDRLLRLAAPAALLLAAGSWAPAAQAGAPAEASAASADARRPGLGLHVSFWGRLADRNGAPLGENCLLVFRLVEAWGRGREVWRTSRYVRVRNGRYAIRFLRPAHSRYEENPSRYRWLVEAPEGTGWIVRPTSYFVRAGTFNRRDRAEEMAASLKNAFPEVRVSRALSGGAYRYTVLLGPMPEAAAADSAALRLLSARPRAGGLLPGR